MKLKNVLVMTLGLGLVVGCQKEGCTDPAATNYNPEAEVSDGSCFYEDGEGAGPSAETITLDCDYFNEDRTLVDNPDAAVDYIVTCETKVTANLIVEPGVVIAFEDDASLHVKSTGSFKMEGTANKPILLTGITKQKGSWRGMLNAGSSENNTMKYVIIEYAGQSSTSHIGYPKAGFQTDGGQTTIENCTFRKNQGNGLFADNSSSLTLNISNSTFTENDFPMITTGGNQIELYNNTNTYTGNVNDYVHMKYPGIDYNNQDITWRKINVPYYITTRIYNRFNVDNANLIIEPGTDIIFATAETHMRILENANIQAIGTASSPIIFRGVNGVQADWGYIIISSGSSLNEITHTKIENAGHSMANIKAAIQVDYESYLNIHDVIFTNNAGYAIGMLYTGGMTWPVIDHANITVDNGKKFCKGANGDELTDPNDPNS